MGKASSQSGKSFYLMEPTEDCVKLRCFNALGKVAIFGYFANLHEATHFGNRFVEEQERKLRNVKRWRKTPE